MIDYLIHKDSWKEQIHWLKILKAKAITKLQGAGEAELATDKYIIEKDLQKLETATTSEEAGVIENEMMTEIEGVAYAEEAIFEIFKNNIYIMEKTVYYVIKIYGS